MLEPTGPILCSFHPKHTGPMFFPGVHGSPEDDVGFAARRLPGTHREVRWSGLVIRQRRSHRFRARYRNRIFRSDFRFRQRLGGAADGDPGEASGPAARHPVVSRKRYGARNLHFRHSGLRIELSG